MDKIFSHLNHQMHAALQHASGLELFHADIIAGQVAGRYPDYFQTHNRCARLVHMVAALDAYVANDLTRPNPLYLDRIVRTPCSNHFCDVMATYFCERYPSLRMSDDSIIQVGLMLNMLLDYMAADPRLPDPLFPD